MTYSLTENPLIVIRDADGASVPSDPNNVDWQIYQAWLAKGNIPSPYTAPPTPPASCQLWQLQAVMTLAQWSTVQSAVAALNNPAASAFFAHGTNSIPANSTTLVALGGDIGLNAAQVGALVAQASTVVIP